MSPYIERWQHATTSRRTRRGTTVTTVHRRGLPSIVGSADLSSDGSPVADDIARRVADAVAALPVMIDGTVDTRSLDRLAEDIFGVDALVGTDGVSWHETTGADSGLLASDWNSTYENPRDIHTAAVRAGFITADEYHDVRDGCAPVGVGVRRRIAKWPTRYRLRGVWVRDGERGADHEIPAPHTDSCRIWMGHRLIDRVPTKRQQDEQRARRSVIVERSRSDVRDAVICGAGRLRSLILSMAVGDSVVAMVNGKRVRVSYRGGKFTATVWRENGARTIIGKTHRAPITDGNAMADRLARYL